MHCWWVWEYANCTQRTKATHCLLLELISIKGYLHHLYLEVLGNILIMSHHQHGYAWTSLVTLSIVHCFRQVFKGYIPYRHRAAVIKVWASRPCLCSAMWRGPQEYIPYELVLTSPPVSCMSGSFNFDSFPDGW